MIKTLKTRIYVNNIINTIVAKEIIIKYRSNNYMRLDCGYFEVKVYQHYADFVIDIDKFIASMKSTKTFKTHSVINEQYDLYFDNLPFILDEIESKTGLDVRKSILSDLKLIYTIDLNDQFNNEFLLSANQMQNSIWSSMTCHDFLISAGEIEGATKSKFATRSITYCFSEYNDIRNDVSISFSKVDNDDSKIKVVYNIPDLYTFYSEKITTVDTTSVLDSRYLVTHNKDNKGVLLEVIEQKKFWSAIVSLLGVTLNKLTLNDDILLSRNMPDQLKDITDMLAANESNNISWKQLNNDRLISRNTSTNNKNKFAPLEDKINTYSNDQTDDVYFLKYLISEHYFKNFLRFYDDGND